MTDAALDGAGLVPPPAEEALDTARLLPFLAETLPGAAGVPEMFRFAGGGTGQAAGDGVGSEGRGQAVSEWV